MEALNVRRRRTIEPSAPVMGGIRWRRPCHDIFDMCRRSGGFTVHDPEAPVPSESPPTEPGAILGPLFVSTPPIESRVGDEYAYQARAIDSAVDGFTWYFEKSAPDMVVDRHTGKVTWTPSEGGYVEIVLCARSLYGTMSRQSWTICVRKAARVRTRTPVPRFREALRKKIIRIMRPIRHCWRGAERRTGMARRATAPPELLIPAMIPLRI